MPPPITTLVALPQELQSAAAELPDRPRAAVVAARGFLLNPPLRGAPEVRRALDKALADVADQADETVRALFEALGGQRGLFAQFLTDLALLADLEPADSPLRHSAARAKAALEMASVGLARKPEPAPEPAPAVHATPPPPPAPVVADPEALARDVLLDARPVLPRLTDDAVVMAVHNLLRHQRLVALLVGTPRDDELTVQLVKGVAASPGPLAARLPRLPVRVEFPRRCWGLAKLSAPNGEEWPRTAEALSEPLASWPADLCGVAVLVPTPHGTGRPLPTAALPRSVADHARGRWFGITPLERYMAEVVRVNGG